MKIFIKNTISKRVLVFILIFIGMEVLVLKSNAQNRDLWSLDVNKRYFKVSSYNVTAYCNECNYKLQEDKLMFGASPVETNKWYGYSLSSVPNLVISRKYSRAELTAHHTCTAFLNVNKSLNELTNLGYNSYKVCPINLPVPCYGTSVSSSGCHPDFDGFNVTGSISIIKLPRITGVYNTKVQSSTGSWVLASEFTEGDIIKFVKTSSWEDEGTPVYYVKKIVPTREGMIEKWVQVSNPNAVIVGDGIESINPEGTLVEYRVKVKKGIYNSSNWKVINVIVYPKPIINLYNTEYNKCKGNTLYIPFTFENVYGDFVNIQLKGNGINENIGTFPVNNLPQKTVIEIPGYATTGDYQINVQTIMVNNEGESYAGAYSISSFKLNDYSVEISGVSDNSPVCSNDKGKITIDANLTNGVSGSPSSLNYSMDYQKWTTSNYFSNIDVNKEYDLFVKSAELNCLARTKYFLKSEVSKNISFSYLLKTAGMCDGTVELELRKIDSDSEDIGFFYSDGIERNDFQKDDTPILTHNKVYSFGGYYLINGVKRCEMELYNGVKINNPKLEIFTKKVNHILGCKNELTKGSIEFYVSGGLGNKTYFCNPSSSLNSSDLRFENLSDETYTIRVNDENECEASITNTIQFKPLKLDPSNKVNIKYCYEFQPGEISLVTTNATNGIKNYTREYNSKSETFFADELESFTKDLYDGNYKFTILDNKNCSASTNISIGIDTEFSIFDAYSVNQVRGCPENQNGEIKIEVKGGDSSYDYYLLKADDNSVVKSLLNSNKLSYIFEGIPIGHYTVKASCNSGCDIVWPDIISISYDESSTFEVTEVKPIHIEDCYNSSSGKVELVFKGYRVNDIVNYTITGPQNISGNSFNNPVVVEGHLKGQYTTSAQSGACISEVKSYIISAPEQINFDYDKSDVSCFGNSNGQISVLSATDGNNFYSNENLWCSLDGTTWKESDEFSNLTKGNYSVQVALDEDGFCPSKAELVEITEPERLECKFIVPDYNGYQIKCNSLNTGVLNWEYIQGGKAPYFVHYANGEIEDSTNENELSGIPTGVNEFWVSDINGCVTSKEIIEYIKPNEIKIHNLFSNPTLCFSNSDGAILFDISGGIETEKYNVKYSHNLESNIYGNFSHSIGTVIINQNRGDVPKGEYAISVTDINGCMAQDIISVDYQESPQILITKQDVKCYGGLCKLTVNASYHDSINFKYNLNGSDFIDGTNIFTFNDLVAGEYTVNVKEGNRNCIVSETVLIKQPDEPLKITNIEKRNITTQQSNDGFLKVTAAGGTPPYQVKIFKEGQLYDSLNYVLNLATFPNLPAAHYQVEVIDANACSEQQTQTILAPEAPLQIIELSKEHIACKGFSTGKIEFTVSGGWGGYRYWVNGVELFGADSSSIVYGGLAAGSYEIITEDLLEARDTLLISLSEPEKLSVEISDLQHVNCFGEKDASLNFTVQGNTAPYQYAFGDTSYFSLYPGTLNLKGLGAGNYSYRVIDKNGCVLHDSVTIEQPLRFVGRFELNDYNGFQVRCRGAKDSVRAWVAGGTAPYGIMLGGDIRSNIESEVEKYCFSGLRAGTYTLEYSDANGCVDKQELTLKEADKSLDLLRKEGVQPTCFNYANAGLILQAQGGAEAFNYSYKVEGLSALNRGLVRDTSGLYVEFSGLYHGMFQVSVSDTNNCIYTDSIEIDQPARLEFSIGKAENINCYGESTGLLEVDISGGTKPYRYSLNGGDSLACSSNLVLASLPAQLHELVIADTNSCSVTHIHELSQQPDIVINKRLNDYFGRSIECFGGRDTLFLEAEGGTGNYCLSLNNREVPFEAGIRHTVDTLKAGRYKVFVRDEYHCSDSVEFSMVQPDSLKIDRIMPLNIKCFGANTGEVQVNASGGISEINYNYFFNGIGACTYNTETVDDTSTRVGSFIAGEYALKLQDANGCQATDTFKLTQPKALEISFRSFAVDCKGSSTGRVEADIKNGTEPYNFEWTNSNGNTICTSQHLSDRYAGVYTLTVSDLYNCTQSWGSSQMPWASAEIIEPANALQLELVELNRPLCNGDYNGSIKLSSSGGWSDYSYLLNGVRKGEVSLFDNLNAGSYTITVQDSLKCEDTKTFALVDFPKLEISALDIDSVSCPDYGDGMINVFATGGKGVYEYSKDQTVWGNLQLLSGFNAGAKTVYVKDENRCVASQAVDVPEPKELGISVQRLENTASCDSTGLIEILAHGGTAPYNYRWLDNSGDQKGSVAEGLKTGSYDVVITDKNNCTRTLFAATVISTEAPEIKLVENRSATCKTTNDGLLEIEVITDSIHSLEIYWEGIDRYGAKVDKLLPGIYDARIKTEGRCYNYFRDTVKAPANLESDFSVNPVICKGKAEGRIAVDTKGGLGTYTHRWFNAAGEEISTGSTLSNLYAGIYRVQVDDESSCNGAYDYVNEYSIEITEPDEALRLDSLLAYNSTCFGTNNATAEVKASGGYGNWQYACIEKSYGTESRFTKLSAGIKRFYVLDAMGCVDSVDIYIGAPDKLVSSIDGLKPVKCYGLNDAEIILKTRGGTKGYEYLLKGESHYTSFNRYINLAKGEYTIYTRDANSCMDTLLFELNQPDSISIYTDNLKHAWCSEANGEIEIRAEGGSGKYTVLWGNSGGQYGATAVNLMAGAYKVSIADSNGCKKDTTYSVIDYPAPMLEEQVNIPALCSYSADGRIQMSVRRGSGPFSFNWFGVSHSDSLRSESLMRGSYKVAVQDVHNCNDTLEYTIGAPDSLIINQQEIQQPLCFGDSSGRIEVVAFGGTGEYIYKWNSGINSAINENLTEGEYKVSVTDENDCLAANNFKLNYPAELFINRIKLKHSWCSKSNGYIALRPVGGTGTYSYHWREFPGMNSDSIAALPMGVYKIAVNDAHGCNKDTMVELINYPEPRLSVEEIINASCSYSSDGAVKLKVNQGSEPFSFTWDDEKQTSMAQNQDYTNGDYKVVISDVHDCYDTLKFSITAPDSLYILPEEIKDPVCFGYKDGAISVSGVGGTQPYTINWSDGQQGEYAQNLVAGKYSASIRDAHECNNLVELALLNPAPVVVNLEDTTSICSNQSLYLDAGNPGMFHLWYNGNGYQNQQQIAEISEAGLYHVEVRNFDNCLGEDSVLIIGSQAEIDASFLLPSDAYVGDTIVMIEVSWPLPDSIKWNTPESFEILYDNDYEIEFICNEEGSYSVGLTTHNDICSESMEKEIRVLPATERPEDYYTHKGGNIIKSAVVYPVPAYQRFNLDLELSRDEEVLVEIMHLSGKRVHMQKLNGNRRYLIDYNNLNLNAGVYTLRISVGDEVRVKKVVIVD